MMDRAVGEPHVPDVPATGDEMRRIAEESLGQLETEHLGTAADPRGGVPECREVLDQ
jgi:hypothetical protein